MDTYILEIKKVTGNRIKNGEDTSSIYFNDTLTYSAPAGGAYIQTHALEASCMEEAVNKARAYLSGTLYQQHPKQSGGGGE